MQIRFLDQGEYNITLVAHDSILGHVCNDTIIKIIDVEGYEEFVLEGAEKVLSNPKTGALIIELASYNRYGSSNDRVHEALNKYGFFPIKYLPYKREFTKLKTYRKDQFNTIYIRDEKFTKNRLINSIKYNVGNQWI